VSLPPAAGPDGVGVLDSRPAAELAVTKVGRRELTAVPAEAELRASVIPATSVGLAGDDTPDDCPAAASGRADETQP